MTLSEKFLVVKISLDTCIMQKKIGGGGGAHLTKTLGGVRSQTEDRSGT